MAPTIPADRICVACDEVDGKYKCPRCMKYTCSLACNKKHREEHPPEDEESTKPSSTADTTGASDIQPITEEDLSDKNLAFQKLFKKYPHLSGQLHAIAEKTDPPSTTTMTPSPEHSHRGQGHGQQARKQQQQRRRRPWTRDVGMQDAMRTLQRLRDADATGALQEFCELVRVVNGRRDREASEDTLKRLAARQDARTISQLIQDEED